METVLKTAPLIEPVSLDEAKRHLRIDIGNTDHDIDIYDAIADARTQVETITWRKLITQTWYAYLQDWPRGDYIELPFGNLQSVTPATIDGVSGIKYIGSDGTAYAWDSDEYIVGTGYQEGRITLADGYTWPNETLYPSNPIEIVFICGWLTATAVPGTIKRAIKLYIGEYFENREISIFGTIQKEMETANNLLSNYRLNEL